MDAGIITPCGLRVLRASVPPVVNPLPRNAEYELLDGDRRLYELTTGRISSFLIRQEISATYCFAVGTGFLMVSHHHGGTEYRETARNASRETHRLPLDNGDLLPTNTSWIVVHSSPEVGIDAVIISSVQPPCTPCLRGERSHAAMPNTSFSTVICAFTN